MSHSQPEIRKWKHYGNRIKRDPQAEPLKRLNEFSDAVLVSGCQRSGTSMTAGIISDSAGITPFSYGREISLDGALILSGFQPHEAVGRHCFQMTYLNSSYTEFFKYPVTYKMVWLLRNPYSVVYSMLYNWGRYALDELFWECGLPEMKAASRFGNQLLALPGVRHLANGYMQYQGKGAKFLPEKRVDDERRILTDWARMETLTTVSRLERACYGYRGKVKQLKALRDFLGPERLLVVEYDVLVRQKETLLPALYDFIGLPYDPAYAAKIHTGSLDKAKLLTAAERATIRRLCTPIYKEALPLVSLRPAGAA